jgi:glycosyltransferase involved in cell wall biosynthesis
VTAVYNVARYLDDFIGSIESQTFPWEAFEVIAVDDGSTDDSLRILREWEQRRPGFVTVVTQANSGQAVARNTGMELARGAWITFTDPDDVIEAKYLSEVASFLDEHPATSMVATHRLILDDATGVVRDTHPLRRQFVGGNQLRDLAQFPGHFHGSAPASFFPLAALRTQRLLFDEKVRPNFEDGHFCCHYLLGTERPAVGFVSTARYYYRKRHDSSSTLQASSSDPRRYSDVLRFGFLDVLQRGAVATGVAPEWLQNFVLYEISWYFSLQDSHASAVSGAVGSVADEFHELMAQIIGYIAEDTISGFSVRPLKPIWREILLHGYNPTPWHSSYGHVVQLDKAQGLVKIAYRYQGDPPHEELRSGGELVPPAHAKVRDIQSHGRVLLRERIIWLSSRRSVRIRLNGRDLDLQFSDPRPNHIVSSAKIRRYLDPYVELAASELPKRQPIRAKSFADRLLMRISRTRLVRRYLGDAWVLMDRITDAGDSGERLFRYLRKSRRSINAWFVVEGGSPDWRRLRKDGYLRIVPHGSLRWKLLMANCRHLISSHADAPIMRPPALLKIMEPRWRFTFLQHGVIKDDLSGWLNGKQIDLFITSTPAEYASVAGDHTPYTFTTKEVKLTGLPRFDRLLEIGAQVAVEDRNLVLLAPTWRTGLVPKLRSGAPAPFESSFYASGFIRNWMALVNSPRLAQACHEAGLVIGFLPHPNLQPALPGMDLPPHVQRFTFADSDVQLLFASSAVMVTDYSSMAFNAAYLDRPVVYFQFDSEEVFSGAHLGRRGYFEYERDGFGPVAYDVERAIDAITDIIRAGRSPSPIYQARIDATFPQRDGHCCKRVVDEISHSGRRVSFSAAATPEPAPQMPDR